MAFLLEHLPPHVHVVISTRADPDLPLARWRVRGELVEIRAADLRFTSDEAAAYLNDATGLDLTAETSPPWRSAPRGGSPRSSSPRSRCRGARTSSGFIARFAGDDRYIVDYLVEEVLDAPTRRRFATSCCRSAVLDRLTGPLCDAVTGRDDGSEMLTALERANLFLVALDDRREWYRYHHLFADVLRARLLSEQPDQVPLLHQRASHWYETPRPDRGGGPARPGRPGLRPGGHLMELAVPAIRRDRQEAMLLGWLKALPDDAVRRSPVLSVFYGVSAHGLRRPRRRSSPGSTTRNARWPPYPTGRRRPGLTPTSSGPCRRPSPSTGPRSPRPAAMWPARRNTPGAPWTWPAPTTTSRGAARPGSSASPPGREGDVTSALETFTQAVASLHAAGNLVDELSSTVVLADMWLAAGRPSKARRLYQRALQSAEAHGDAFARATADLHVGLSELDAEVGDLDERPADTSTRPRRSATGRR